jgi:hypothetical protein
MHNLKRSFFWFTAFCILFALNTSIIRPHITSKPFFADFRAFYCAGLVSSAGENSYRIEPLRTCEHHLAPDTDLDPGVVLPAPLPGYDLAFFALFAKMPIAYAIVLWETLLSIAFCITIFTLTRLTSLEPELVFACFFLSDAAVSLTLGQIALLSIAALACAMLCISRQKFHATALFAALTLIEPHIGLGACLSLLFFVPQCRPMLIATLSAIVTLSLSYNTPAKDYEYLHTVLPSHVYSEIKNQDQYSFTHILSLLGADDNTAYIAGQISYLLLLAVGIFIARKLARSTGSSAFFIAIPPAFVTIGGPFIHIQQIPAALPALLLLLTQFPSYRLPYGFAAFLLSIPWIKFQHLLLFSLLTFALSMLLSARLLRIALWGQVLIGMIILGVSLFADIFFVTSHPHAASFANISKNALAEDIWRLHILSRHTSNQALMLILQSPTWLALLTMATTVVYSLQSNIPQQRRIGKNTADPS